MLDRCIGSLSVCISICTRAQALSVCISICTRAQALSVCMSICTQTQALSAFTPQQVSSDEIGIGEDERRCLNEAAACNNNIIYAVKIMI